jgi:proliferating cell nuclear antigen
MKQNSTKDLKYYFFFVFVLLVGGVKMECEIEIAEVRNFKKCIDSILNLVKEGNFEIDGNGISLKAMDPSQISMVIFSIGKDAFASYSVKDGGKIGIDLEYLSKILGRWKNGERVIMRITNKKFEFVFLGEKSKRNFAIPAIDVPSGPVRELKIDYIAKIKMPGKEINDILQDSAIIGPHVKFFVDKGILRIESYGENSNLIAELEEGDSIKIETTSPTSAVFSQEYLYSITKECDDKEEIEICISGPTQSDPRPKPLCAKYKIGNASLIYYLAPRIETE